MKFWVGVASKEHVARGAKEGFIQVCHGKVGPLAKMKEGDWIVYYSPKLKFLEKEPCQAFTAIAQIQKGEPYLFQMSENFIPYRRDARFFEVYELPISSIIQELSFIKNKVSWGFIFRRGCFSISEDDFKKIASKMHLDICL